MTDERRFLEALKKIGSPSTRNSIGTLGEKALHRTLKLYYEPNEEKHEQPYLGCLADILNEDGITEIQTGSLAPLAGKLKKLLPHIKVTVVYPIVRHKQLVWLDPDTGELTKPRKSPKNGKYTDALPELSRIGELLFSENLTVRLLLLDATEYKYLDGYGKDKKKRATKIERIPKRLVEQIDIRTREDMKKILPELVCPFTSEQFNKATHLKGKKAFFSMKFLEKIKIVERTGKKGRAFLYEYK